MTSRARRLAALLWAPAVLVAVCIGVFWKITLTNQYVWFDHFDAVAQILPWYQYQANAFQQGYFPLWDPHHWGGQPLAAQGQPGTTYPLNWLLFLAQLRRGFLNRDLLGWHFALCHVIGAFTAYLLARELGASRAGSIIGAISFAYSGVLGTIGWPQMLNGGVWAPAVLLFLVRLQRRGMNIADACGAGVAVGVSFLSGHHQIPIFLALTALAWWLIILARQRLSRKAVLASILGAGTAVVSAAPLLVPALEYGRRSVRWVGAESPVAWNQQIPYHVHERYSVRPVSLLGMVVPGLFVDGFDPFAGVPILLLCAVGARRSVWLAATGIAGLFVALGGSGVIHGLLYSTIPLVEKARSPGAALVIVQACMAALAAGGFDLLASLGARGRRLAFWLFVMAGILRFVVSIAFTVRPPTGWEYDRLVMTAIMAIAMGGILYLRDLPVRAFATGALVILGAGQVTTANYPHRQHVKFTQVLDRYDAVAEFLKAQPKPFRVSTGPEIEVNLGDWYGFDQATGHLAGITSNVYGIHGSASERALMNAVYHIGKDSPGEGYELVFTSAVTKVFRYQHAFNRAWIVHETVRAAETAKERPLADMQRAAIIENEIPGLEVCEGDQVDSIETGQRTLVKARVSCTGLLVISSTYYPGMVATIDGRPARIHQVYGFLTGIVIPAGQHSIALEYRPVWRQLVFLAPLSLVGAAAALLAAAKRKDS